MARVLFLLLATCMGVVLNLVTCRWGTDVTTAPVMTFSRTEATFSSSGSPQFSGLFAAPMLVSVPWLALVLGVLLPLTLLGIGVYVALRQPADETASN